MRSLGRLFSLFGTQPTSALCLAFTSACDLSTTSTTVTSARYPTKASNIITYALSPKSSVYILLHRNGLDGLLASVQFDDDSAHFNSHITRYSDGVCRRCRYSLCARTKKREVGQTSESDKIVRVILPSPHIPSVSHFHCDSVQSVPTEQQSKFGKPL